MADDDGSGFGDDIADGLDETQETVGETANDTAEAISDLGLSDIATAAVKAAMSIVWGLFRDLFTGLYIIPLAMVGLIGWVFLGSDRSLQRTVEGFPGIGDLPILVATYVIEAAEPVGTLILTTISETNYALVSSLTGGTGILTMALVFVVQVVELGVLVYALWAGAQFASAVPYVGPALTASGAVVTKPFRMVMEVIR
jgi:hypothetical protein